jgi:hypothetical protein
MRTNLFEFAILWHPTSEQAKKGEKSKIISKPEYMLAKDVGAVNLKAAKSIPDEYDDQLEQIEIAVRPF